jgi:hypothetical protein
MMPSSEYAAAWELQPRNAEASRGLRQSADTLSSD